MTEANKDWRRIVDDHRPRPRELLRCERELAATPPTTLPESTIESLVQACRRESARPVARRRALAVAAALVVCLVPLGWVGARVVLPERQATPFAVASPSTPLTGATTSTEGDFATLARLDDDALAVVKRLQQLCSHTDNEIARAAREARADLLAFLSNSLPARHGTGVNPRAQIDIATNDAAQRDARIAAIHAAQAGLHPTLAALRDARLADGRREVQRVAMVTRLQSLLR